MRLELAVPVTLELAVPERECEAVSVTLELAVPLTLELGVTVTVCEEVLFPVSEIVTEPV